MRLKLKKPSFIHLFQMVTAILLGLAQTACDNSGQAEIVSNHRKNGPDAPFQKPTTETGIAAAGHSALSLFSVREVLRLMDIAIQQDKSQHLDEKCQVLSVQSLSADTSQLTLKNAGRRCTHIFGGEETLLITRKNNQIFKVEKKSTGTIEIKKQKNNGVLVEIEIRDGFVAELEDNSVYKITYTGNFNLSESVGEKRDTESLTIASEETSADVNFNGTIDFKNLSTPLVKIIEITSDVFLSQFQRGERQELITVKSVLGTNLDTECAPTFCGWPAGRYQVRQTSEAYKSVEFTPVITVTENNQILVPNTSMKFSSPHCLYGLDDIKTTLSLANDIVRKSSSKSGRVIQSATSNSTNPYGSERRKSGNQNQRSGSDKNDKKDNTNKKKPAAALAS